MFTIFTTEQNLFDICGNADSIWYKVITRAASLCQIVVSTISPENKLDSTHRVHKNLRLKQIKVYPDSEYVNNFSKHPEKSLEETNPVFLVEIGEKQCSKIQERYGIICIPIRLQEQCFLTERGWRLDTEDPTKEKSWSSFFSGINPICNSIAILDRYFFASEAEKKNGEPDETIQDSYNNIREILDALLPKHFEGDTFHVLVVFDNKKSTDWDCINKCSVNVSFNTIKQEIQKIVQDFEKTLSYHISVELLTININNPYYADTHDRHILTNYTLVTATHKVKAFQQKKSLSAQEIIVGYLFSELNDERSSLPLITHQRIVNAITKAFNHPTGNERHSIDGIDVNKDIENRIFQ